MIDRQTVDRIIDAANIYDVVSDYVSLRRSGASYKGLCPFHDDKTPSFYVNPAKGVCKCFSCGKGGNAVGFIMEIEQMTFPEALRHLAKKFNIEVKEDTPTQEELKNRGERERMLAVNDWAANFFHDCLLNTDDGKAVGLAYFRGRGFRDDIIDKFKLGYAPDKWSELSDKALKHGFKEDVLLATSLSYKKDNGKLNDKFRGRVMFPWFSLSGQVIGFGGRVLDSRTKGVNQKYINSNDSEVYHKLQELYGLFQAKRQIAKDQLVYMVEGYTDVLSMHQCGVENVVANSGTALNDAQIRLLKRFTDNITLVYDSDEAGIHAAIRGTDMLLAQNMNVKVLLLPDGEDPDSFARKHSAAEFRKYVEQNQTDFIIFKLNQLMRESRNDPRKRSEVVESILASISVIPDEIVRSAYIHECSQLMNMDEQMLMRRCVQLRKANYERRQKEREQELAREERLRQQEDQQSQQQQEPRQAGGPNQAVDSELNGPHEPNGSHEPYEPHSAYSPHSSHSSQSFSSTTDKWTANILGMESLIMREIVRYGERKLVTEDEDGNAVEIPVATWVENELNIDGMEFLNPMYKSMMDEIRDKVGEEGFSCRRYFLASTDYDLQRVVTDMLSDRYRVDSTFNMADEADTLDVTIPRMVLDYKYFVVRKELQNLKTSLADKQVLADPAKMEEVMTRYKFLTDVQRRLATQLGDRVMSA